MTVKMRGADIVVKALEDAGARLAFGIPGTHNIELYDALERSRGVPILVTDEQCAGFMADAVARTTGSLGVANVVPGAGVTHCLSGVAEAFMDGVPLLVLTCGVRADTGHAYQLHDIDQLALLRPVTKGVFKPENGRELYPTLRRAVELARAGTPGPVAVEIAADLYLLTQETDALEWPIPAPAAPPAKEEVAAAAEILNAARRPLIYAGAGAAGAAGHLRELAEKLSAPVATTISGKGVFPETHPLWLWPGLGASTPPYVRELEAGCDAMLAVGCRFSEVATGSYGFKPPENLIHADVNPEVFNRNFPAKKTVAGDAAAFLRALLPLLRPRSKDAALEKAVAAGHALVREDWRRDKSKSGVTPAVLFESLQKLAPDAVFTTDSGNGTFLAMEHLRLNAPGRFLGPIDFSCMGYSVPAAVAAKLAAPERDVVALAGDGALLMTGLELMTAAQHGAGVVVCVLRDGDLGQIAQFQQTALGRRTCTALPAYKVEDFARAAGADYLSAGVDAEVGAALGQAFARARAGRPVMVEVAIDYSRKTYFTRGVVLTNFRRLPLGERLRLAARAAGRFLGAALK